MIELAIDILLYIAFLAFALKRLMTYLHALQQDDYDNNRLFQWIVMHKAFDKRLSILLAAISAGTIYAAQYDMQFVIGSLYFFAFALYTYVEKDPRKQSKKKLAMTSRAQRIFFTAFVPIFASGLLSFMMPFTWQWIVLVQLIPVFLILANYGLIPIEDMIQKTYWNEASAKINQLQPKVIGITGSFGKTSVKHILGHILKMSAPTLITPGSVNTPMGITRIIREELDESHKFFIVEMGAYGPGSIARLCRLTPPDMGIITAIGHAHYERFKTLDTVAKTKYELAQAVIEKGGKTVIHERTLRFPYSLEMKEAHKNNFIVCGEPAEEVQEKGNISYLSADDATIQLIQQNKNGLEVKLTWKDTDHVIEAPLYGLHHGHNLALAFVTALELGIDVSAIHTALSKLPQIEHRLEVKQVDDTTIIDDAFNSNPVGFRSALDLMNIIKGEGRSILITPGMVEMGKAHNEAHESIGKYAGDICDIAIVVKPKRIPTFIKGFKETGSGKKLLEVKSFEAASKWVEKHKQANDVILIENDLPDLYERVPKM